MKKFLIEGGHSLQGTITVQGAKNAAQKILPATIVFPGTYLLRNVPAIQDTSALLHVLCYLGATVEYLNPHTLRINTEHITTKEIPPEIAATSTGTFLFAGALLSRCGKVKIWHPGGDRIGKRPITWHLAAFQKLGASVIEQAAYYEVRATKLTGNRRISFVKPTANGTVNAVIAAARAQGEVLIENVAPEPEIANFVTFMQTIGANVTWADTHTLRVNGVESGHDTGEIDIIPDRNDAATWIIAAALGHGPVTLSPLHAEHLLPLLNALRACGVQCKGDGQGNNQSLTVQCDEFHGPGQYITSRPYPGFSTDWGPMMQVLLSQLPEASIFQETIFAQRFAHIKELIRMGANISSLALPVDDTLYNFERLPGTLHAIHIKPSRLNGTEVHANDVRAGAALVLAGLVASGETRISGVEQIERGYEHIVERLSQIGVSIQYAQEGDN